MTVHNHSNVLLWTRTSLLCLCLPLAVSSRIFSPPAFTRTQASENNMIPWQSETHLTRKDWDNLRRYQRSPPSEFAPGGRLHSVEKVMEAVTSDEDPTSNLVVAIHCRDGIVVVSHAVLPSNAALFLPKPTNDTSTTSTNSTNTTAAQLIPTDPNDILISLTQSNLYCVTAGNAVHSQVLKHRIRNMAESMAIANDDGLFSSNYTTLFPISVLARRLADQLQKPTQSLGGKVGRMLVCSALLVDANQGIWQVDPTGQFWKCRVAIAGRGAKQANTFLLNKLAVLINNREQEEPQEATNEQVEKFLETTSLEDALQLAKECLPSTINSPGSNQTNSISRRLQALAYSITRDKAAKVGFPA